MKNQYKFFKSISLIILALLILSSISSLTFAKDNNEFNLACKTILFVGGSGYGNYSSIQSAINDASSGDTIFVYNGTYFEHVIIDKTIDLIGEDKNITIIDGSNFGDVISILVDNVSISGFTIQNSGDTPMVDAGVEAHSNNNIICDNSVSDNGEFAVGIYLNESSNNTIKNNKIFGNGNEGVYIEKSENNFIQNNEIFNNGHCSVVISESSYNTVVYNDMYENHDAGVSLWPDATHNEIAYNTIHDLPYSGIGIWWDANDNYIHDNDLYNNPLYGIKILDAKRNLIENNIVSGSNQGIIVSESVYTNINKNYVTNNNYGINILHSTEIEILQNTITENNADGVYIVNSSNNSIIENNIFLNSKNGLHQYDSCNNLVYDNYFSDNADGIYISESSKTKISGNKIVNNDWFGIWVSNSTNNIISTNTVKNNDDIGVFLDQSSNNDVISNIIIDNDDGIYLSESSKNTVTRNNFNNYKYNAFFVAKKLTHFNNKWNRNYWERPRLSPYLIPGTLKLKDKTFPVKKIDWMPLSLPYKFYSTTIDAKGKNTLYVGGLGNENYNSIQSAINDADNGDTVYIYNGTYYEPIIINKSINLIGEDKENTILDGNGSTDIITILADNVTVTGFTIRNGHFGILIKNSSNHSISSNYFNNSLHGISIQMNCSDIEICKNTFDYNQYSIRLYSSSSVNVYYNNFKSYKLHAFFVGTRLIHCKNKWNQNYWDKPRWLPYPILGKIRPGLFSIRMINFDWKPLKEPYIC